MATDVFGNDVLRDGELKAGVSDIESFNVLMRRVRLRGRSTVNAPEGGFPAWIAVLPWLHV